MVLKASRSGGLVQRSLFDTKFRRAAVVGLLGFAVVTATGCSSPAQTTPQTTAPAQSQAVTTAPAPSAPASGTIPDVTELKIKDLVVGKGATAKVGSTASVNYTGWLTDGTQFDSSIGRAPFEFVIGQGGVIEGWDKGVAGMKVGGKRELIIPPTMGYGAPGSPPVIPPNATLRFDIELLSVK
jgi:FKBP-type peptidyl-prolyl cis-trans isomerase